MIASHGKNVKVLIILEAALFAIYLSTFSKRNNVLPMKQREYINYRYIRTQK